MIIFILLNLQNTIKTGIAEKIHKNCSQKSSATIPGWQMHLKNHPINPYAVLGYCVNKTTAQEIHQWLSANQFVCQAENTISHYHILYPTSCRY